MYKQATRKINLNLNIVEPINFELLDDWLISVLKIDIKNTNTLNPVETLVKKNYYL
ncbi:MAG: hypothetical protein L3J10_04555 [Sulfurimonas sp.]|nr:hypothetical protein [Sulfurimonas sp.]